MLSRGEEGRSGSTTATRIVAFGVVFGEDSRVPSFRAQVEEVCRSRPSLVTGLFVGPATRLNALCHERAAALAAYRNTVSMTPSQWRAFEASRDGATWYALNSCTYFAGRAVWDAATDSQHDHHAMWRDACAGARKAIRVAPRGLMQTLDRFQQRHIP